VLVTASTPNALEAGLVGDELPMLDPGKPFGPAPFTYTTEFDGPRHLSAIRAGFASTTSGVPTRYRWEALDCATRDFQPIAEASDDLPEPWGLLVLPRRKTWFVEVTACGLRLVVAQTNGGPPAIEWVEPIVGARDVLLGASVLGSGTDPQGLVDGSYERGWMGEPGKGKWTIEVRLSHPERIDRVRAILGADATTLPRPRLGRDYAIARAPRHWELATSVDGANFETVAQSSAPVRRPFIRLAPRPVVALRLTLEGATDDTGRPTSATSPMVRELAAYSEEDRAPIVVEPWVLSVNANPAESGRAGPGGELANDAYFAKFLQKRFASLLPAMARDDRYARRLGNHGELLDAAASPSDGRALEAMEGDDPALGSAWLGSSWPPPIVVLSGSNDWEYARRTTSSAKGRTRWNPLLSAREGGMGDLAPAVKNRAVPFLGFCGGAQILALLEARTDGSGAEIDAVLRRNNGRPIRGFASKASLIRGWPGEGPMPPRVTFEPSDPLFVDLAGPAHRNSTHAFPQSHLDLVRPEAFVPGGPLARMQVLATSLFCSPAVVASLQPLAFAPNPNGAGRCARVTEVFRSIGGRWPIVGAQFHAEQRDFDTVPASDPAESAADAHMFVAAAYEEILDAYFAHPGVD
jgi:hypothetical protein